MKKSFIIPTIIVGTLLYKLCQCNHNKLSRAFKVTFSSSREDKIKFGEGNFYCVCLKCQKKVFLDWDDEKQVSYIEPEENWFVAYV
jgi:hypothetical protein